MTTPSKPLRRRLQTTTRSPRLRSNLVFDGTRSFSPELFACRWKTPYSPIDLLGLILGLGSCKKKKKEEEERRGLGLGLGHVGLRETGQRPVRMEKLRRGEKEEGKKKKKQGRKRKKFRV
ncbi:uncharacterized protein LOC133804646 [Humulus lupulus]|uniref:uncharacterized protein LOC133804646 n=1 Tax=Humulus lupulus TaxID=3486 RepID=UPI002B40B184|nr:uncharacterized protein LOC133804646 [Humulus lupulus]